MQNAEHNKRNFDVEKFWTDAPIALLQGGGIRASIRNDVNDGKFFRITLSKQFEFHTYNTQLAKRI